MPSTVLPHHSTLFDVIQARLALTLDEHRRADTVRIVEELIAAREIRDLQDLVRRLSEQSTTETIWQKFIRIATIGETYFFRDRNQLNALQKSVLPRLIEQRRSEGRFQLRLWSAGCSTGEEPYTLGIMLREMLPDFPSWSVTILGTDLNINHIERARQGVYRPWSFRAETPIDLRERWFIEKPDGFHIHPTIQSMVTFAPLNLVSETYPSFINGTTEMDIVLCRNVLIYFDYPTAASVISRFSSALRPDGWMVLGHAESAHVTNQDFEPRNFENAVLYQKRTGAPPQDFSNIFTFVDPQPILIPIPVQPVYTYVSKPLPPPVPRVKKATTMLTSTPEQDPWVQARRAADQERWPEALRWLAEAEKRQALRAEVHYLRGIVELQLQEVEKAMSSLRRAIYCDTNFVLAHFTLGEVYEKLGQYKRAAYEWSQAQTFLTGLAPEASVAFSDDLSVEMMNRLLQYRLEKLPNKS